MCPSRKTTLCSSPCTIKSTSDTLLRKALKTIKQPRKVLKIGHINICSLRNKVHKVNKLLVPNNMHISETHLDYTFDDTVVAIQGYNIYRKDGNANGGSVAVYIKNHIPLKLRDNLMLNNVLTYTPSLASRSPDS